MVFVCLVADVGGVASVGSEEWGVGSGVQRRNWAGGREA